MLMLLVYAVNDNHGVPEDIADVVKDINDGMYSFNVGNINITFWHTGSLLMSFQFLPLLEIILLLSYPFILELSLHNEV